MFYKLLVEHSRDYHTFTVDRGILQFVEPTTADDIVALDLAFDEEELSRFTTLVEAVWRHIVALDLPDVSAYPEGYAGIIAFEDDLIDGAI